jgi:hypothetical protein
MALGGFGVPLLGKSAGQNESVSLCCSINQVKTSSKRPFPIGGGLFSGAVTALQLPLLGKDFHNKKYENQHINHKKSTPCF